MSFRIAGLDPAPLRPLYGLTDVELAAPGAVRRVVDAKPGFPDRVALRDLEPGEFALPVDYVQQPAARLIAPATRSSCVRRPRRRACSRASCPR